jgi:hypothetical protein
MSVMTRRLLDPMGCATPNCGHDHSVLYLHQACHPNAGTLAKYDKPSGSVIIECKRCKKLVVQVKVADQ